MNNVKKIFALLIAMVMVLGMGTMAFATEAVETPETVTITVNRDSSYAGEATEAGRAYTWYKIFSATYTSSISSNASGYESDGSATFDAGGTKGIAYTATAAVAAKLGTIAADGSWTTNTGNKWFDLTPIAGSDDFTVAWRSTTTADVDALQEAAAWLVENKAYEATDSMDFNGSSAWTADVDKGYYVIKGDVGDNLIAATTDITVNEKNDYPPIEKEEEDEDSKTIVDTDTGKALNVAIGDSIDYTVTVTIPLTAKIGDTIEVWDKPSSGLTYNDDVVATPDTDVTDGTVGTGEAWHKIITVTADNKGTGIVFAYTMTINDDALVDTGRMNEATLKYGDEYESLPHTVKYTTYFTGVHKIDDSGSSATGLEGVKFDLFEDGKAFNVTLTDDGYYIPGGNSNEVVTDADGYIYIRGLDKDKTYTLTETETLPGYNMLEEDVTLVLVEDKEDAFDEYDADSYQNVVNNKGATLPSTGGIGTTIFYVVGGILVVAAGVLLVTKKRMSREG